MLKVGIVGLPNVGKSTFFNALTSTQKAETANYPFCTIEPNIGRVSLKDNRLLKLAEVAKSQNVIPSFIEFVDIAGLVKGANQGEGLGNKFLGHIREVDAIIMLVRCFENENITHVNDKVDPITDLEIIETELILADLESIQKHLPNLKKKAKTKDTDSAHKVSILKSIEELLNNGIPARVKFNEINDPTLKQLHLLTTKPILYCSNVNEHEVVKGNAYVRAMEEKAKSQGLSNIIISAKIEAEIAAMENEEDKHEFLKEMQIEALGLDRIVKEAYNILSLNSYFTAGPKEARSWTFKKGLNAAECAGIIHSDFERGFIAAEVISWQEYINYGGEQNAKELGKIRREGRHYLVEDGDVIYFRFNV